MENKLLKTIRGNNREFNKNFVSLLNTPDKLNYTRSFIKKSRISELETLTNMIWRKNKTWGGGDGTESDRQVFGYNEAIFDITYFIKETIKKLK